MKKTLLALLAFASFETANAQDYIISEYEMLSYDKDKKEISYWLSAGNDIVFSIKKEHKVDFPADKLDGKTKLFELTNSTIEDNKLLTTIVHYAFKDNKPVILKTETDETNLPEDHNIKFPDLKAKITRPADLIKIEPYYLPFIEIKPTKFEKNTLFYGLFEAGRQIGEQEDPVFLHPIHFTDKSPDFKVLNFEKIRGELFEVITDYAIKEDGTLEARVKSERKVTESEKKDYKASLKYNLRTVNNLTYKNENIMTIMYSKGVVTIKTPNHELKSNIRVLDHPGYGNLPDFVIIDEGYDKHYFRFNVYGIAEKYYSNKGEVEFSNDLFLRIPKIKLRPTPPRKNYNPKLIADKYQV